MTPPSGMRCQDAPPSWVTKKEFGTRSRNAKPSLESAKRRKGTDSPCGGRGGAGIARNVLPPSVVWAIAPSPSSQNSFSLTAVNETGRKPAGTGLAGTAVLVGAVVVGGIV